MPSGLGFQPSTKKDALYGNREHVCTPEDCPDANEIEIPAEPKQFLIVEYYGQDPVFVLDVDSLDEAASFVDQSETERTNVSVYNLDNTEQVWTPVLKVVRWFEAKW